MYDTARARIFLIGLLLAGHVALFPLFALQSPNPAAGVFPTEQEFIGAGDEYIGNQVTTEGTVQSTAPIRIQVQTTSGTHSIRITGIDSSPAVGDNLRVHGQLRGPTTIHATTVLVVPQQDRWYAWGISFLAGLWVLSRLIRHWTIDRRTLGFHPRARPLSVRHLLWGRFRQEGDDA